MPRKPKAAPKPDLVEVWLSDPDQKRPPFGLKTTPLEYLSPDVPLPRPGDIIHLPRNVTGDTKKQAFGFGGTRTPFRVVECSWVYFRDKGEKFDPLDPQAGAACEDHHARQAPHRIHDLVLRRAFAGCLSVAPAGMEVAAEGRWIVLTS